MFLPDTAQGGWIYFNRYFYAQLDKEGLVIDERYNNGGQAANHIIDALAQPLLNYWAPREGPDYTTPFGAVFGPKAMIINEYAGSGGDAMPYYFRKRGVGPLVGKRTWGGLVGIEEVREDSSASDPFSTRTESGMSKMSVSPRIMKWNRPRRTSLKDVIPSLKKRLNWCLRL